MNDLEQLVKYTNGQFERLQLMLIYRNTERMLGDVLLGGRAITLVFYRHAVPYKYSGKLIAQNILDSVWHVMTVPSGDLPLKQLDTLEDFDSFLQSTDKAVILFDFCGWVQKILTSEKKKTRVFPMEKLDYKYGPDNLNRDELLEKSFTGSFVKQSFDGGKLKQDSGSNNEAIEGNSLGRDRNIQTSPESVSVVAQTDAFASEQGICETGEGSAAGLWKDGLYSATYGNNSMGAGKNMTGMSSWKGNGCPASEDNDDLFHELSCTSDEYKYFEVLHTDLTKIARDNLLPPERQRFGLLSNRTMMCAVGLQLQHAWSLMLQFPDCPNCSKTFNRGGDLKEFVLASQPYVTELQGEGYKLAPPLSTETPSLILFIDRASPSAILRQKSKEALQALRQVAFHYGLSNQSDEGNGRMAGESLLKYYSDGNVRKKTNLPPSNPLQRQVLKSSELSKLMSSGKNMVIQVKTTEGEFQIVNLHRNGESSTGSLLQQRGPTEKLKEYELGLLAKEAGFQLLSSDFETEIQKLFQVPETLSSSSEKETGQVEDLEESLRSQSFDSESYQISGDSAYITDNILSRHNSVSTTHGSGDGDVEQVFEIGLGDDNFYPEGYQNVTVAQDNSVIEEHKQCRNKHSINETLDRSHDEEQCKSEIIENSGDQFSDLSEKPDEEPVAEENVRQKPDIHPEIENVKKEIYLIRGEFANRESTVVYTGEEESFEKHDKNLGKLDDKQDKNYAADILFFYSDGGDQMRRILSPDATIPAVVIIDPVIQEHFVFPNDIPVTYSSLIEFVNAFLNGNLQAHKHSEPFPPSPREPPRPPFVNRDFHEVDSIPRVTLGTFSRLVLGFDDCNQSVETPCANGHRFGAAWRKDVLVLFSNNWCGFCKRLELVVREVHRFFKGCTNILHAEGRIAPNSSFQDILSFSTKMNREKTGDISKDETANNLPSIFHMDCTLNDCSSLLKFSNQWKELYPTLLLFPAGKKDAPIAYEGDMLVNKVIEFVASYGSTSSHLYGVQDILEKKKLRAKGQAGFRKDHRTIDHIFTLRAIIEEAKQRSTKVSFGTRCSRVEEI
eukprot:Gb_18229 [translate_table: standard]